MSPMCFFWKNTERSVARFKESCVTCGIRWASTRINDLVVEIFAVSGRQRWLFMCAVHDVPFNSRVRI